MLADKQPPHWARAELAALGQTVALDSLAQPDGAGPLAGVTRLVMAQPRPLSPDENVALDAWVRGGGRLLLIADPALTEESAFSIGDPRRPISGVLLSPILRRWGLDLRFDDAQDFGERTVSGEGIDLPVNLPGSWQVHADAPCTVSARGLVAECTIGKGRVLAVADAAVLDRDDPAQGRRKALAALLDRAFAP